MKRIFNTILIAFLVVSTSCNKFLDVVPTDSLSPKNFFKNEADVNAALSGVYDVLGKSATYGRNLYFEMDVADDSFVALSTWTQDIALYNYNPSDTKLTDTWTALYNGINRANMLLENIGNANMDANKKKAAEGEALFLRAYYYFLLVSNWGNVPLRLTATASTSEVNFPNTPYKTTYEQIVRDMEKAAEMVYPIANYSYGSRVTKSVVWGILARVNLKMAGAPLRDVSRYAEVKKWAEMVKTAGHSLNPDYRQVFINMSSNKYDTKEVIWEVEFGLRNGTQDEEGSLGSINGIGANATIGYSYGAKHTTEKYYKLFDSKDLRRDWTISPFSYGTTGAKNAYTPAQIYNRYDAKWRREFEPLPRFNGTTQINFPILRYSDVLLMLAEAENEMSTLVPPQTAIDAVNEVRRRAYGKNLGQELVRDVKIVDGGSGYVSVPTVTFTGGGGSGAIGTAVVAGGKVTAVYMSEMGSGYTSAPSVSFSGGLSATGVAATATAVMTDKNTNDADLTAADIATKEDFRRAVRKERGLELGYEGLRRFDLIRWGEFYLTMKSIANEIATTALPAWTYAARSGQNVTEKDTLFAIPAAELNSNRDIIPNRGW
ncbi:RagB/SusD family nutrient uptake outer membrane protein [Desertivirga xinjiangensis]|uniref:RagB/SusD family nutrient uptake outer membrane protein n=1 Tax=Desertivirga xinjiangensis TaxID=539206 RepID=UPI00210D5CBB|nr:RagB/SusD family nutrient uptake outer membrane protein [Pedobacter xinjiangensis]